MRRVARIASIAAVAFGLLTAAASATPGWECVPTTAGQAVVSGGTGASPSCGSGTTAVLAPTFVSAGVGGKPTVQFSGVNVQVVSGSGSTSGTVNGEGNLIIGYAENKSGFPQSGSNDLVVGADNGWSNYGELVGGSFDKVTAPYSCRGRPPEHRLGSRQSCGRGREHRLGRRVLGGRRQERRRLGGGLVGDRRQSQHGLRRQRRLGRRRLQERRRRQFSECHRRQLERRQGGELLGARR